MAPVVAMVTTTLSRGDSADRERVYAMHHQVFSQMQSELTEYISLLFSLSSLGYSMLLLRVLHGNTTMVCSKQ